MRLPPPALCRKRMREKKGAVSRELSAIERLRWNRVIKVAPVTPTTQKFWDDIGVLASSPDSSREGPRFRPTRKQDSESGDCH